MRTTPTLIRGHVFASSLASGGAWLCDLDDGGEEVLLLIGPVGFFADRRAVAAALFSGPDEGTP